MCMQVPVLLCAADLVNTAMNQCDSALAVKIIPQLYTQLVFSVCESCSSSASARSLLPNTHDTHTMHGT